MEYHRRRSAELLGAAGVLVFVSLVAIVADDYVFKDLDLLDVDSAEVASAIAVRSDLRSLWNGITILTWAAAFGTTIRSLWHDVQATRTSRPRPPGAEAESTRTRLHQFWVPIFLAMGAVALFIYRYQLSVDTAP